MTRIIASMFALSIGTSCLAQDAATALSDTSRQQSSSPSTVQALAVRERIEIIAGSDKEEASISTGRQFGANIWNLSLTTPIDKENKQGTFADLNGLSDAIRGKLTYMRQLSDLATWNQRRDFAAGRKTCVAAGVARGFSPEELEKKLKADELACDALTAPGADDDELYKGTKSPESKSVIARTLEPIRRDYLQAQWGGSWVTMVRSAVSVGTEEFEFFDATTFAESDSDETEWSASVGFAWVNIVRRMSVGVGYRRESVYEPNTETTLCSSTPVADVLECETGSLGGPVKKEKDLATVQLDLLRSRWALTSLLTYDFESDDYGIELPLYLLRDENAAWTGGVSVGWTSEERDVTVQIFVGVPFSLFD